MNQAKLSKLSLRTRRMNTGCNIDEPNLALPRKCGIYGKLNWSGTNIRTS